MARTRTPGQEREAAAPGRRTERRRETDARLREAVLRLLGERGYRGVTVDEVAAVSGVAKTTIYRRWSFKGEMVFDLAVHGELPAFAPTGDDLPTDLRQLCERIVAVTSSRVGRTVLPGVLADMADNPGLAARVDESFVVPARAMIEGVLARAVDRGELRDVDGAAELHAVVLGTALAWELLVPDGGRDDLAARLTDHALALLRLRSGRADGARPAG